MASFKKIRVGDVVTGTVIDVTEDQVIVDLKTYADGVIRKEDLSEDPDFNMQEAVHPGDEITATVMATNDGEGNMVLSKKEANAVLQPVFLDPDDILQSRIGSLRIQLLITGLFRLCIRIHTLLVLFLVLLELLDLIHQLFRLFGFVFCFQPV